MEAEATASPERGPTLVLDGALQPLEVGLLREGAWVARRRGEGEALQELFRLVEAVLEEAATPLDALRHVALGIGPGSTLGLRLTLMALRTWQQLPAARAWRLHQFHGLHLFARLLAADRPDATLDLLTDFRRGQWHHVAVRGGAVGDLAILGPEGLSGLSKEIHYIPGGRNATEEPPGRCIRTTVTLAALPGLPPPWFEPVGTPTLYLPSPPRFARWKAERHR